MAFKGTLKEFKVPDILQWFSLQGKTGILTFTKDDGFITLIFELGLIVGVDSFPRKLEMRVGSVLVKQDIVGEEMLQRALTIQKRTKQKIGEVLIGMGLVEERTVKEALKTQAVEIVLSLFKWKKGSYDFKVMETLDPSMKVIDPMPMDNMIMEGVQMLDEWPLIMQHVPNGDVIFQPAPIETDNIKIIDEDEDEKPKGNGIFLSQTEAGLLKYIDGKNRVKDLVDLGIFTEYKVYKGLFNLVRKSVIVAKEKSKTDMVRQEKLVDELRAVSRERINKMFFVFLVLILVMFIIGFFKPLRPLNSDNVLLKGDLYERAFTGLDKPRGEQKKAE
ncbi:MAG: DUF4388 domain-containing protein [Candidatus Aminicenantes bacterium]|nr:DUF4388 domain-containing protein [Candidatus Aminicenantes bacterium]